MKHSFQNKINVNKQTSWLKKMMLGLLVSLLPLAAMSQNIKGKVTSSDDGSGLPGVSIAIKGTTKGTTSDGTGSFTIAAAPSATLVFSAVGFITQEIKVGSQSNISIVLKGDPKELTEVVVVGYGTQKKSQLTGAISSVTAKQITEQPITNIGQALQGRVAGVDVAQAGSRPGALPTIRIRGRRSFNASNDPLYVVDGIPLSAGYEDINPSDVASLEVLKDASAAAIYGARGANGVILVTTKRGNTSGKTTVSYDTYFGVTEALDKIKLFTGAEFAEYKREALRALGTYKDASGNPVPSGTADAFADSKLFEAVELDGIAAGRTTDYQSLLLRQGFRQNHSLGVQGGTDKTQFYLSASYFLDKGVTAGLDFTRFSLRANVDHRLNKTVKIGIASYMMNSITNGSSLNPYGATINANPLGKPYDTDGNLIFSPTNDALLTNPLSEVVPGAQVDETTKYRIFNSLYTELDIVEGLKFRVNFGPDFTISKNGKFTGALTNAIKGGSPTASTATQFGFNWTLENILTYSKTFNKDHNFNLTLLQSIQKDNFQTNSISVLGVPAEAQQFNNLSNASSVLGVGSNLIEWTINSYMARINYDYKDKYLLTATLRRDGSSRFGENTKYGNFPGIALAWNISNEPFMKDVSFVDILKLRISTGSVGNQAVAPYQTQGLLSLTSYAFGTTAAFGYRPGTIGNPDLRWESSTSSNIGLDFALWRGRISGSFEVYKTNTTSLLLSDFLTPSGGFAAVTKNVGETQNSGIELGISTVNVDKGGFKWTTDLVFGKNTEKIISLYNGAVDDLGNRWFIGYPLSAFFDYKKAGIWQTSEADAAKSYGSSVGQIKVQDTNNDGKINADDRVILGSEIPDWYGSIQNRVSYKGFDLSFYIVARIGQTILSGFHRDNNALAGRYQQIKVDYWTPNNPTNEFPQPKQNQEFPVNNSAIIYFDGSYVKVRNINFGYTFPDRIVKKLGFQSLRLFTSIQQPFIWSSYRSKYNGIDPESPGGTLSTGVTPAARVMTFGLNVKF